MVRKIVLVKCTLAARYSVHCWYKFRGSYEMRKERRDISLDAMGDDLGSIRGTMAFWHNRHLNILTLFNRVILSTLLVILLSVSQIPVSYTC